MKGVRYLGPRELDLVDFEVPAAVDGQAVLEVDACGICGSDLHTFERGLGVEAGQILGHEFAGTVLEAPGVKGVSKGDRVTVRPLIPCGRCAACLEGRPQRCEDKQGTDIGYGSPGAMAERVLVPDAALGRTIFRLPEEVDTIKAALTEPLAVSLHAVRVGGATFGQSAVVMGQGMIGLGVTYFLARMGLEPLVAVDVSPLRRDRAATIGATSALAPVGEPKESAASIIAALGGRADIVVECSGSPKAFETALRCLRPGGTLVVSAMYSNALEVSPGRLVGNEQKIVGAFAYQDEFPMVIDHLARPDFDPKLFISHEFTLTDYGRAFATQLDKESSIKVLIRPHGESLGPKGG